MYEDINKILNYIEEHLYQEIKLKDISNVINYSKSHISREFNKYLGISLPKYIMKRRLSNAAIMIYTTDKPIGYIADTHGFGSDRYFITLFKKELGISPLNYRKRNGFIYLFPKRVLKGGKTVIMKNLEDIEYQINVNSDSAGEVSVELKNVEYVDNKYKLELSVNQETSGESTLSIEISK